MTRTRLIAAGLLVTSTLPIHGQSVPVTSFEVVSIKPNLSGREQMMIATPPGGLRATNANVRMLIRFAFDIPEQRLAGLENWTVTEHFDVVATAAVEATAAETKARIRTLLADRFGLKAHIEQRDHEVDVLTVENPRRTGPNLTPSTKRCEVRCDVRLAFGRIEGTDVTIADIAYNIGFMTRRDVVDRTGLTGRYDFLLVYTPDQIVMNPAARAEFPSIDPGGPLLRTAVKEQLGLRLQTRTEPMDVLVVDRVERPTPD